MRVKSWHVPPGFWFAVILVAVLSVVTAPFAAEAEAEGYDAEDCRKIGRGWFERGEYEEALKWYDGGLALEPENVYLLAWKAEALYGLEKLEEAVAYYDRALELTPEKMLPDYEGERIITILGQPPAWSLHNQKADILAVLGRREEAIESYDQALKFLGYENVEKKHAVYESKIKALKELGKLEEALEGCDKALARDPADKNLYRYKVKVLIELGRYEEAARTLARASETGVENALSYVVQIEVHLEHDEYEKAELYADVAAAFYPDDARVLRMKGWTSTLLGKYDEGLEYYDRALALDADDIRAWNCKVYTLLYLGEPKAALQCVERVLELEPDYSGLWNPKGAAYFMLGEYAQARASFEKELHLIPPDRFVAAITRVWQTGEQLPPPHDEHTYLRLHIVDRADGRSGVESLRPLLESPDDTWEKDIGRFLAGEIGAEDLLTVAGADKSLLCEGHCYVGFKYKFDGDAAAARRHFEEAVATEARRPLEYILAQYELRRRGPTAAPSGAPTVPKVARVKLQPPGITGAAAADDLRSSAVIARIVNQRKAGIEYIYKKYFKADPDLEGKLVVRFTVAASGAVTACSVVSSTLGNAAIDQEVCDRILMWRFPPIDAGDVDVVCPFVFSLSRANYVEGGAGLAATERYGGKLMKKRLSVAGKVTSIGGEAAGEAQRSPQVIARVIRRYFFGIEYAYNSASKKNPNLGSGKVTARFTILASGSVGVASIATNTLGSPALSKGILARVQSWRFPKVESGSVTVVYEFVFAVSDW